MEREGGKREKEKKREREIDIDEIASNRIK